ncbi:ABC transporter permease [Cognatishimia sp. SS12]|nr:ABC transporter permease [Cognatishimia sp. SS12]
MLWEGLKSGELFAQAYISLLNLMVGLTFATLLAVCLGILIGANERVRSAVWPLVNFIRSIPPVAIIPIVIVAFGAGPIPSIILIAYACNWPIMLNVIDGIRGLSPSIRDACQAFRLPPRVYFTKVLLPASLPQLMAGIRLALAVSLTIMMVTEFYAANKGLGFYINDASQRFAVAETWAGTFFVGIIGYLLSAGFLMIERRVLGWYFEIPRPRRRWLAPRRLTRTFLRT